MTVWCRSTWLTTDPSEYVAVVTGCRVLDRLRDGDAETSRRVRLTREHTAAELGLIGRGGEDLGAPRLHECTPVRLLLVRDLDHVDHDLESEQTAGERERRSPLPGAGLRGQALDALLGVVVGLRDRGVGLVRPRRRGPFVLVEN